MIIIIKLIHKGRTGGGWGVMKTVGSAFDLII